MKRRDDAVVLAVEDDGPGLDEAARRKATSWGKRLDATAPGSGFGLAIVADLAALYEGELSLGRSDELGGLRADVALFASLGPDEFR